MDVVPYDQLKLVQPRFFDDVDRPDGVGYCTTECPSHDGKRCHLTGNTAPVYTVCPIWARHLVDLLKAMIREHGQPDPKIKFSEHDKMLACAMGCVPFEEDEN